MTEKSPRSALPITLWGQFLHHLPRYAGGMALLGAYQYSQYWFDTRLMRALDAATHGQGRVVLGIGISLILVASGAFVIRVLSRIVVFNAGRIAEYELRQGMLEHLQVLGPSFYRRMSAGEIMSRATNDLMQIRLLYGFGLLNLMNVVFALASSLAVTLGVSWKLTIASFATLPALFLVTRLFSKRMFSAQLENQQAIGKMSSRALSSIAGVRVVRSFALEEAELGAFAKYNEEYLEKSLRLARIRGLIGPIMQAISALGILVVFWYGGSLILRGEITPGEFLGFYRALVRLSWPLVALGFIFSILQRGRAAFSRVQEILDSEPDVRDGTLTLADPRGALSVRKLSFAYQGKPVLHDVTFELPAGGSLAIVGRTGSGKSTLAVLLPRLQPTPRGTVFLDGVDVCDLPLSVVRQAIGYAQQTAFLFSTTIGRNIGYSLDDPDVAASEAVIRDAATEAQILSEVERLPEAFDTVVGERGVQLSGGQKQRTSLARALVAEPKVLVLDDPLSAVDAQTERSILEAIDRQKTRRGVILVTHRVAAASRCDRIVVLDEGRVIEQGTHDELSARGGLYAMFAEEQRIERELDALGELPELTAVSA